MFADSLPEFGLERIGGLWVGVAVAGLLGAAGWWWVWLRRRYRQVTVNGRSMEPMYRDGDRVLVRVVSQRRLRIGDIVVIEQPDAEGIWRTPRVSCNGNG